MQEVLKIKPIAVEQTLIDTAHSLIDLGLIKPRNKKAKSPTTAESPGELIDFLLILNQIQVHLI